MSAVVIDKQKEIEIASLLSLKGALKLEIVGMRRRGASALSIAKKRLGLSGGTTKTVFPLLVAHIHKLEENYAHDVSEQRLLKPFHDEGAAAKATGCGRTGCPYETKAPEGTVEYARVQKVRTAWMTGFQNASVSS